MLSWLLGAEAARRAHSRSLVREQLEPLNCRGPHCTARFTHRPVSVPGEGARRSWPCLSLGKCLPEDASQALCACFRTRCKFFLFKALTFSQLSVSSSSFVQQAHARLQRRYKVRLSEGTQMAANSSSAPGFSLGAGPGLGAQGRQRSPSQTWDCLFLWLSWYFCACVTHSDQIVRADSCRWMVFSWRTSSLSLRSCQFSQLYISPLCQPLFSSPLSLSPPCAIF